jgi:phosphoserine/homoserine phosphotransferase
MIVHRERQSMKPTSTIACLDLEGVLIPEIWITIAEHSGIDELRATTRDIPDYDTLMRRRLAILQRHDLRMPHIDAIIAAMQPLPGAVEFLQWLRSRHQVVILSDTYYEFAAPLMRQLGWPTLFCNQLDVDEQGRIIGYRLRQRDPKRCAVAALRTLNFRVVAVGDSYNDLSMLAEADLGILFCPPQTIGSEYRHFQVTHTYEELRDAFLQPSLNTAEPAQQVRARGHGSNVPSA